MKPSVRSRGILEALREREELTVEEACELFDISPATARRDFAALAESGKAEKTWGGLRAVTAGGRPMLPSGMRETVYLAEKRRIAATAATLCQDGEIIFIDGGTTTLQLAGWFADRPLRIVTNSLLVAHEIDRLRSGPLGAEVFLTSGYLYPRSGLLVGPEAIKALRGYHATRAFISVGGLGSEGGTNNHPLVVEIERAMIECAGQVVVLADHSKFGRRELMPEFQWDEVDVLVTDQEPPGDAGYPKGGQILVAREPEGSTAVS